MMSDFPSHLPDSEHVYQEYVRMMDVPESSGIRADVAPALQSQATATYGNVGDVERTEIGSGARYISGKPPLDLLPISVLWETLERRHEETSVGQCLFWLGEFQRTHDIRSLRQALLELYYNDFCGRWTEPARVLEYGRRKYAAWNWSKGQAWSIPLACAVRHILAILDGEVKDPESGEPHRGHVAANILFLLTFADTYPEGNDLPTTLQPRAAHEPIPT